VAYEVHVMKQIQLTLVFSILAVAAFSQRTTELDRVMENVDQIATNWQKSFYVDKTIDGDKKVRERWNCAVDRGNILFRIEYQIDSLEYYELYYGNRAGLIYSEEFETMNYTSREDEVRYGGIYYFRNSGLQHFASLGRKTGRVHPSQVTLARFDKRLDELKSNSTFWQLIRR
jgi:hypothetical protein